MEQAVFTPLRPWGIYATGLYFPNSKDISIKKYSTTNKQIASHYIQHPPHKEKQKQKNPTQYS